MHHVAWGTPSIKLDDSVPELEDHTEGASFWVPPEDDDDQGAIPDEGSLHAADMTLGGAGRKVNLIKLTGLQRLTGEQDQDEDGQESQMSDSKAKSILSPRSNCAITSP